MIENIINVPLKVQIVGHTLADQMVTQSIYLRHGGETRDRDVHTNAQSVIELAGRTCYGAYGRKNQSTDSHEGYIHNMLSQNHLSVLEHASVSFYIEGISRAETHELVRHRHFSFSQQSQRYVIVEKPYKVALHPTLLEYYEEPSLLKQLESDFDMVETIYNGLRREGLGRKQASEAARAFMPNAAATEIVVTGNLRSWIEFVSKRDHPAADAGIRRLAQEILSQLERVFPEAFSKEARVLWSGSSVQEEPKNETD